MRDKLRYHSRMSDLDSSISAATGGRPPPQWLYFVLAGVGLMAAGGGASVGFNRAGPVEMGDAPEVEESVDLVDRVAKLEKKANKHDRLLQSLKDNQLAICEATGADCGQ